MFLSQVFCLEKMGVIPLLRRLGGAKDQDDREALWEAAETYHRLHQVPQLLLVEQTPPPVLHHSCLRWSSALEVEEEQCMDLRWLSPPSILPGEVLRGPESK